MTFCVEGEELAEGTGIDVAGLFELCAKAALAYTGCPHECETDLTIAGSEEVRELNRRFRDKDDTTDVLSFPMLEFEKPGDFRNVKEGDPDLFDPETKELILGSIVINIERAKEQAAAFGHSLKREMAFLIVHSMLHLQGFDHMEDDERIVMEKAQEEILDDLNIPREAALEE